MKICLYELTLYGKLANVRIFKKLTFRALALRVNRSKSDKPVKGRTNTRNVSLFNLWPIYLINSADKTKFSLKMFADLLPCRHYLDGSY